MYVSSGTIDTVFIGTVKKCISSPGSIAYFIFESLGGTSVQHGIEFSSANQSFNAGTMVGGVCSCTLAGDNFRPVKK